MSRLKNKNHMVPNGFALVIASTGYDLQRQMPHRSFNDCVNAVQAHLRGNAHQTSGMASDYESVSKMIEAFTVKVLAKAGYTDFIMEEVTAPKLMPPRHLSPRLPSPGVAGAVAKTAAGVGILLDWLGSGGRPVDKALAESRAGVCVLCPENQDPNWFQKLTGAVAEETRKLLGIKNDLALTTSVDDRLFTCQICLCNNVLKVHTPIDHVKKHTSQKTMDAFPAHCWVKKECAA